MKRSNEWAIVCRCAYEVGWLSWRRMGCDRYSKELMSFCECNAEMRGQILTDRWFWDEERKTVCCNRCNKQKGVVFQTLAIVPGRSIEIQMQAYSYSQPLRTVYTAIHRSILNFSMSIVTAQFLVIYTGKSFFRGSYSTEPATWHGLPIFGHYLNGMFNSSSDGMAELETEFRFYPLPETVLESRDYRLVLGYDYRNCQVIRFPTQLSFQSRPEPCKGCNNYHGKSYNETKLICAIHPYGWDGEKCPDHEAIEAKAISESWLLVARAAYEANPQYWDNQIAHYGIDLTADRLS